VLQHPVAVRAAFEQGATSFLVTLTNIADDQWDTPGLGEWTVRELCAHALRAFTTIETYLSMEPVTDRVMADAGEYFRAVMGTENMHAAVAQRSRAAGAALSDPVGETEATVARVLALVASTLDDDPVNTFAGQMTFIEYLATRCVELGVHTLDLQRATGQPPGLRTDTAVVALTVLTELADPATLLLAITGRAPLPADFNVLG
jgi:uncharacterized protein (TIGR03083 family)